MAGHPLPRRGLPALLPLLGVGAAKAAPSKGPEEDWHWLRGRFLAAEGRMVPANHPGATESGFQAVGLLAALHADDMPRFERILSWSLARLRRPDDHLWVWRREEKGPGDSNNSTHADLLAAWALIQASERWRRADLRRLGQSMAQDILARCLLPGDVPLLLPAAGGFFDPRRGVLSPGGVVLPALPVLAQAAPDRRWEGVRTEALSLVRRARFGDWGLVPDWLELDRANGRLALARGWPPRFSAIALGAVLYLCWAGLGRDPPVAAALSFWNGQGEIPAWADLREGRVAPHAAHAGLRAVAALAEAAALGRGTMDSLPVLRPHDDEEVAGLVMLCRMAWREIGLSRRGE